MKIILDPGHGGNTPGKRSPVWADGSQLLEFEFNRNIVKRIKSHFPDAIVLVPEVFDLNLYKRVERVNRIVDNANDEECLLISVHANAGGGSGWEVWTTPGQTASDQYASMMHEQMQNILVENRIKFPMRQDRFSDGDVDKEENFYILARTKCPAILTENFFMDTEKDCRFIMSEYGRSLIALAHINFIKSII